MRQARRSYSPTGARTGWGQKHAITNKKLRKFHPNTRVIQPQFAHYRPWVVAGRGGAGGRRERPSTVKAALGSGGAAPRLSSARCSSRCAPPQPFLRFLFSIFAGQTADCLSKTSDAASFIGIQGEGETDSLRRKHHKLAKGMYGGRGGEKNKDGRIFIYTRLSWLQEALCVLRRLRGDCYIRGEREGREK